jgi:acyl-coenzyme A thioesterase PaaI-like protein
METKPGLAARQTPIVPFADHVGVILLANNGGERAQIPDSVELTNHIGSVHAGALFTLGEAASGAAVVSAFGATLGGVVVVVRKADIRFRKIAHGPITATATLSKPVDELDSLLHDQGRLDFDVAVELRNDADDLVAEMGVEWHLSKRHIQAR